MSTYTRSFSRPHPPKFAPALKKHELIAQKLRLSTEPKLALEEASASLGYDGDAAGRAFAEQGVAVVACHPGIVTSTLLRNLGFERGFDTAAVAAQTPLRLALGPEVASGTFHANKKAVKCKFADEHGARAALWEACEALAAERGVLR